MAVGLIVRGIGVAAKVASKLMKKKKSKVLGKKPMATKNARGTNREEHLRKSYAKATNLEAQYSKAAARKTKNPDQVAMDKYIAEELKAKIPRVKKALIQERTGLGKTKPKKK